MLWSIYRNFRTHYFFSYWCQQLVEIGSKRSNLLPLDSGVPQGSVLGTLLFLVYNNDLPLHIRCSCEMFADDTSLQASNRDPVELVHDLQVNTNRLTKWPEYNHMSLNTRKTKCMYITTWQKRQKISFPFRLLYIYGKIIDQVTSHKVLGIFIDNSLSWFYIWFR